MATTYGFPRTSLKKFIFIWLLFKASQKWYMFGQYQAPQTCYWDYILGNIPEDICGGNLHYATLTKLYYYNFPTLL